MLKKCPYCGSENFDKIETDNPNIKFALTQLDTSNSTFLSDVGLPVEAYGCTDCKGIVLMNENLSYHH